MILQKPIKQGSNAENYTSQDFIHIARALVQDNPGPGQRKPGAETPDLILELQTRSNKAKEIISRLDHRLDKEEDIESYLSEDISLLSYKETLQGITPRSNIYTDRDKLAEKYQFYQDILQALTK